MKHINIRPGILSLALMLPWVVPLIAGADIPEDQPVEGGSLKPCLTGASEHTKDVIFAYAGITRLARTRDYLLDPVWQTELQTGYTLYDAEHHRKHHLSLPHDYKLYEETF